MNITTPIRHYARIRPDAVAVIRPDGTTLTYRELDQTLDAIGARLQALGLKPRDVALVGVAGLYRHLLLAMALARQGIVCAPLAMPAPGALLCILEGMVAVQGAVRVVELQALWPTVIHAREVTAAPATFAGGDGIVGYYPSSGTTGMPKFLGISHDLFYRRISRKALALPLPRDLRQICHIGPGTWYGFSSSVRALWLGGTIVLTETPALIVPAISAHQVNYLVLAPITLQQAMAGLPADGGPLPSLAMIEVGGSDLPIPLYEHAARRLCPEIYCAYGAMETAGIASAPLQILAAHPGAIGFINPGVEVEAVDGEGAPLPVGSEGALRVRSDNCATGYAGNDPLSAIVFRDGWVHTNDLGVVGANGMITMTGRSSDVINKGGTKVSPLAIEAVLLAYPDIAQAAAFGAHDATGVTQIWAAIVCSAPVDRERLRAFCSARLGHASPLGYIEMPALPRTDTGKLRRDALVKLASDAMQQRMA